MSHSVLLELKTPQVCFHSSVTHSAVNTQSDETRKNFRAKNKFSVLCLLLNSLFCLSLFLYFCPSLDLPRKRRFRRGSSHHFWSPSVRPLPPYPPAGLDQRHRPASGGPGLWHAAGALTPPAKLTDATQQHFSSIMYPGFILWLRQVMKNVILLCSAPIKLYITCDCLYKRSCFFCGHNFVYIFSFFTTWYLVISLVFLSLLCKELCLMSIEKTIF